MQVTVCGEPFEIDWVEVAAMQPFDWGQVYTVAIGATPAAGVYFGFTDLRDHLRQEYVANEEWDESNTMDKTGKSVPKLTLTLKLKSGAEVVATGQTHRQVYDRLPKWLKRPVEG